MLQARRGRGARRGAARGVWDWPCAPAQRWRGSGHAAVLGAGKRASETFAPPLRAALPPGAQGPTCCLALRVHVRSHRGGRCAPRCHLRPRPCLR